MSAAKHTPGPWNADHSWFSKTGGQMVRGKSCVVAEALKHGAATMANARLIAAAPELLAACERLIADEDCRNDHNNPCWAERPTDVPGKHWGVGDACAVCVAKAAIAKAKGGA
jgi:hypothetical protein